MELTLILYILSGLIIILGVFGIFFPLIPGITLIFIGILVASFTSHFSFITWVAILILGILTLISLLIDYFSGVLGAKFGGASLLGLVGAFLGSILGFSIFGLLGIIIGPALGVFIFELVNKRNPQKSLKIASYSLISTIIGLIINIIIGLTMIIIFLASIFI
jgi:hypothetical protein